MLRINVVALLALTCCVAVIAEEAKKENGAEKKVESEKAKVPEALAFELKSLDGKEVKLSKYLGKVVLMVNVASECGLTPQYKELQGLHKKYKEEGLAVLGFPCNQFGKQEPGSPQEIRQFCKSNFGVEFDMFGKIDVNGEEACDLYKYLTKLDSKPKGAGKVSWNFEKFLLDRSGKVIARFEPQTKPDDPKVIAMIEASLKQKPAKRKS